MPVGQEKLAHDDFKAGVVVGDGVDVDEREIRNFSFGEKFEALDDDEFEVLDDDEGGRASDTVSRCLATIPSFRSLSEDDPSDDDFRLLLLLLDCA